MKTKRRAEVLFGLCATALGAIAALPSQAETGAGESAHQFTANVALVSDYRFRAISQSFNEPAIQGGFDYSHASGFYAGTWASSVSDNLYLNGAGIEWDFYGGFKLAPMESLILDLGVS